MLSAEISDFGQLVATTRFRDQITRSGTSSVPAVNPHRRLFSNPAFLHLSHFHPAWSEN
jgi:hypothetical protein